MAEHSSPSLDPGPTVTQFSVQLIFHTKVSALTAAGKLTQKTKKDVKSKELSFACSDTNYTGFLCAILDKHNKIKYTVLTQHHFPFKYYHTGWKWVWHVDCIPTQFWSEAINSKGDALDVDQELEYVEMVTKVHEANFMKIIIMVDIEDVKQKCPVTVDIYMFLHLSTAEPLCLLSVDL